MSAKTGAHVPTEVGELLVASIRRDAAASVRALSTHANEWFMAHAPDLIAMGGPEQQSVVVTPIASFQMHTLKTWYAAQLAKACASVRSLEGVALAYIQAAGEAAQPLARSLLNAAAAGRSDAEALAVLRACAVLGFESDAGTSACRRENARFVTIFNPWLTLPLSVRNRCDRVAFIWSYGRSCVVGVSRTYPAAARRIS